jgi:hypothetical protein
VYSADCVSLGLLWYWRGELRFVSSIALHSECPLVMATLDAETYVGKLIIVNKSALVGDFVNFLSCLCPYVH